ncbi:MAG: FeoB-associated Cys-rich membrane protein [Paludibacteraceae bacterium]|nr:FeoB-associated Cys-rich membrane protein [Paludibacteraceae bacterium]
MQPNIIGSGMLEKIIVIVIVVIAVVGMSLSIRRQAKEEQCDNTCRDCPIANSCKKEEKKELEQ